MTDWLRTRLRAWWWWLLLAGMTLLIPLLPISGQVIIRTGETAGVAVGPQITIDPPEPAPGMPMTIQVTDQRSWAHVGLTVNGRPAAFETWSENAALGQWTWRWQTRAPAHLETIAFYTDCDQGCVSRARVDVEPPLPVDADGGATKLCTVLPDPARDWHGRRGWVVDLTYAELADSEDDPYWSVDALAGRVHAAAAAGHQVLVRVDYAQGQSLPPVGDNLALADYVAFVARLARDERLQGVDGLIIGSGPNAADSNSRAPGAPLTPAWVARLLNGYGEPVHHQDNVIQTVHALNPGVRVLVGPVRPWIDDQSGDVPFAIDAPWLNYMNTLATYLVESATEKAAAGVPGALPDGFALHVPGNPGAAVAAGLDPAEEPRASLPRSDWDGAEQGFALYRDWLAVINSHAPLRGLPVVINATNTYAGETQAGQPPAQNYPEGWLTAALDEINREPQVEALCWFLDLVPGDDRWDDFSLSRESGRMLFAAEEFDRLLQMSQ